jgi:Tol biopolymer transport system component
MMRKMPWCLLALCSSLLLATCERAEQTSCDAAEYLDYTPSWSPDGELIALASDQTGNRDIFVTNADGSWQQQLTFAASNEWTPAWSPDGSNKTRLTDKK